MKDDQKRNLQAIVTRYGGPDVISMEESAIPEPATGEVLIAVEASGVGFPDVLQRQGQYPGVPKAPFTLGYDVVGRVERVGPGVTKPAVGVRVAALTVRGGNARYLRWRADDLVEVPEECNAAQAVSLVLNYATAYQMLHRIAEVRAGQRILVHGAAGGVGSALLELARIAGTEVIGTASAAQAAAVESLGGTPVDYAREDFVERCAQWAPGGLDAAFDALGGASFSRSHSTLARGGHLVAYGVSSASGSRWGMIAGLPSFARLGGLKLLPDGRHVHFYGLPQLKAKQPDWYRQDLRKLFELLRAGKIAPVVAATLPLAAAPEAHRMLEARKVTGKIVLMG